MVWWPHAGKAGKGGDWGLSQDVEQKKEMKGKMKVTFRTMSHSVWRMMAKYEGEGKTRFRSHWKSTGTWTSEQLRISVVVNVHIWFLGFARGSDGKESPCNAEDPGSIPGSERSPGEWNGYPLQILAWRIPWTEKPGGLQHKEWDMTEWLILNTLDLEPLIDHTSHMLDTRQLAHLEKLNLAYGRVWTSMRVPDSKMNDVSPDATLAKKFTRSTGYLVPVPQSSVQGHRCQALLMTYCIQLATAVLIVMQSMGTLSDPLTQDEC